METVASPTESSAIHRVRDLFANIATVIWRALANPVLLLILAGVALAMILAALFVPQMPDQFNIDPAAAARWKLGVVGAYGALAGPLEVLGIFNLVQSVLLRILLVFIALMLAVQLGEHIGLALAFRRLAEQLASSTESAGVPLTLDFSGPLYRDRRVITEGSEATSEAAADGLSAQYADVRRQSVPLTQIDTPELPASDQDDVEGAAKGDSSTKAAVEERLLAMNHQRWLYLRPLLPFGLLLALGGLWLNAAFGWEVISPTLSPTERYQHPPRHLEIEHPPIISDGGAAPAIHVQMGDVEKTIAVGENTRAGGVHVLTRENVPALLVQAEPAGVRLSRLGEPVRVDAGALDAPMVLGLEFPEPGREEVLALPDQAVGVRIVRLPSNTYSIELYEAGATEPAERYSLNSDEGLPVAVPESDVTLTFYPSISAVTAVRAAPGRWLLWPALFCSVAGLIGFARKPVFLLTQVAPWSTGKQVTVTQSNSSGALDAYLSLNSSAEADA